MESVLNQDCTHENFIEFLINKGIDVVDVETLTKDDVIPLVRNKTFKITVTPDQYEMALKPEIWPYRVAVRHYKDQEGLKGLQVVGVDNLEEQEELLIVVTEQLHRVEIGYISMATEVSL